MMTFRRLGVPIPVSAMALASILLGMRPPVAPRAAYAPAIASIAPAAIFAGSQPFKLVVNGAQFAPNSQVRWNGSARTTTFVSPTRVLADIAAADVATARNVTVTVINPTTNAGTSNSATIVIGNPVPQLTSLAPASAPLLGDGFTLTVNGSRFVPGSIIRWNGVARPTTFVSPTRLVTAVPASALGAMGVAMVSVFNPAPMGGASSPDSFSILSPGPILSGIPSPLPVVRLEPVTMSFPGSDFISGIAARVNGVARPTSFVNASLVRVTLAAADVVNAGPISVQLTNPSPTVGAANVSLGVVNPLPVATGISPQNLLVQNTPATVTITGSRFVPGSLVRVNGSSRATTFVSRTQLQASIPASDLTTVGDLPITVFTPQPGGGTSATLHVMRLAQQIRVP